MKTYHRTARYWEEVRTHFIHRAEMWSRGSEGRTLLNIALADNWQETLMDYAPASEHLSPADCAAIIIRNILLS
jgi:hypothetical protein